MNPKGFFMKDSLSQVTPPQSSWRSCAVLQQPSWPDAQVRDATLARLSQLPSLVFAGETRKLKTNLAQALRGEAFVLQAGDCSEEFSRCHEPIIHDLLKVILQMSVILTYAGDKKVVKIGRVAGQYAKPRSSDTEFVDGVELPSYRGDMVNGSAPTREARTPDPTRMLEGYFRAAATLNLIRAFTGGGYAALNQVQSWNEASGHRFHANAKYEELVRGIKKAVGFMASIGIDPNSPQLDLVSFYTSHEALLLEYEETMVRNDSTSGCRYCASANMLWIGDRTRQPDGGHVEFLRYVENPVGLKVGPSFDIEELKRAVTKLNPKNEAGRITLITRFGVQEIEKHLPRLVKRFKSEGLEILWVCDPMHGNTYQGSQSRKTRRYEDILGEFRAFWDIHQSLGSVAGGVHLELTGEDVTECTGGSSQLSEKDLFRNYQTNCDPRLNAEQAVELAFEIAETVKDKQA